MVDKVVSRHGARLPRLAQLQETFAVLQHELLDHMKKEDVVLFPAIVALEAGAAPGRSSGWTWIDQPIGAMEAEHASAGAALERIAELTDGHVPPEDACPTFRGLYHGLSELERDMHVHVHLENHILFPRAAALARSAARQAAHSGDERGDAARGALAPPAGLRRRAEVADADDGRRLGPRGRSIAGRCGARGLRADPSRPRGLRAGLAVVARRRRGRAGRAFDRRRAGTKRRTMTRPRRARRS